jgi:hypothetical protein
MVEAGLRGGHAFKPAFTELFPRGITVVFVDPWRGSLELVGAVNPGLCCYAPSWDSPKPN